MLPVFGVALSTAGIAEFCIGASVILGLTGLVLAVDKRSAPASGQWGWVRWIVIPAVVIGLLLDAFIYLLGGIMSALP
jgi:hypothetical protein